MGASGRNRNQSSMQLIKGEKAMTITTGTQKQHTYEVVDHIPNGFFVWNIGDNMGTCDYIPLCEWLHPEDKDCYAIRESTLKALPLKRPDVLILRRSARYGINDLKSAKRALNRKAKTEYMKEKQKLAKLAIEILEEVTK